MVARLNCHYGIATPNVEIPNGFLDEPTFIANHFRKNSSGAIELSSVSHLAHGPLMPDGGDFVDALDLHRCAAQLTGNTPGQPKVSNIAIVLAQQYAFNPNVLGLMFDRGRVTDDDPNGNGLYTNTPREACAIFVGAIRALRPDVHFDRELEFTVIHELGHLFNLGHTQQFSFMRPSRSEKAFADDHFRFTHSQQLWLARCPSDMNVHPGGSPFEPASNENSVFRSVGEDWPVELTVSMREEFSSLTPVELTVTLKDSRSSGRTIRLPNEVDPGYASFRILIADPFGHQHVFKSPRRYCATRSALTLRAGTRYQRDISLSESSLGRTFASPGRYAIRVEWNLGRRGILKSNILEVNVVDASKMLDRARFDLLSRPSVRGFVYHRSDKYGSKYRNWIGAHLLSHPSGEGADELRYALVRMADSQSYLSDCDYSELLRNLELLTNSSALGERQVSHIRNAVASISQKIIAEH